VTGSVAVFLDRDGTLTEPRHYPTRPDHLVLSDGVGPHLRELQRQGVLLIVVTNQSALARGYLTFPELRDMHAKLRRDLATHGVRLDGVYVCPHHPDGVLPELAVGCGCRKPGTGLLTRAAEEHRIDLSRSWMVGDVDTDVTAGVRVGCRTVLVGSAGDRPGAAADYVLPTTADALRVIRHDLDGPLARVDHDRLRAVGDELTGLSAKDLLVRELSPHLDLASIDAIAGRCTLDHAALLIFPRAVDEVPAALAARGWRPGPVIPSVVVKRRLCERYDLDPADTDVRLTHATRTDRGRPPRRVEIFMLAGADHAIARRERDLELERHVALRLRDPDAATLDRLRRTLRDDAGFVWDGGGFNPDEHPHRGGMTVLYFARSGPASTGGRMFRLELQAFGDFPEIADSHHGADDDIRRIYEPSAS
jgi:D-glycero-D-manno-heptose 1,7-bisphosphate phosphatase